MKVYTADLHLHSVLSPCGDLSMSPGEILRRAGEAGLNLIAITDHNMCENGAALRVLAANSGISVLYGMELETAEEVHLVCLFDTLHAALEWQETVYPHLPDIQNDPERFGDQAVVDAEENILRFEARLLVNATDIPLAAAWRMVETRGGLAIPAHVDRSAHSLISQLGFVPTDIEFAAVELSRFAPADFLIRQAQWLHALPAVRFSDAHFPEEIGLQRTRFVLETPTIPELRLALRGAGGRYIAGEDPPRGK